MRIISPTEDMTIAMYFLPKNFKRAFPQRYDFKLLKFSIWP